MLSGDPGSDLAVPGALLIPAPLRKPRHSPLALLLLLLIPLSSSSSSTHRTLSASLSLSALYVEGVLSTGSSVSLIKKMVEVVKL